MNCGHWDGAYHNCEYVEARNRLIPVAEALATREVPLMDDRWGPAFLRAMDRLWIQGRGVFVDSDAKRGAEVH